jgi:hypothetical protein
MNEFFTKSRYDHPLFTFFFVFISPIERCSLENIRGSWCVTVVNF